MNRLLQYLVRALSVTGLLVLAACETPVDTAALPEMTFAHLRVMKLDVAAVEIDNRYVPPLKAPNVEHLFPTPPAKALDRWAKDRLRPVGKSGVARLVVTDAKALETALKRDTSLTGAFTKQQSHRYDLAIEATLEILDAAGRRKGFATATATRSQTVREDANVGQRERIWYETTDKLMRAFDYEMEKNMRRYLTNWLSY